MNTVIECQIKRQARQLTAAALFAAGMLATGVQAAEPNDTQAQIFTTPPAAHELADILFPSAGRSIVIGGGTREQSAEGPKLFGLLINFEFGETTILPESLPYLDSVGEMLNLASVQSESIIIEGHTDAIGESGFNDKLSQERARAVKRYLISVHNVDADRLHPVGKGETELYDSTDPSAAINRRVQFRPLERQ